MKNIVYTTVCILVLPCTQVHAKTWEPVRTPPPCIYSDTLVEREENASLMRMCYDPPAWLLAQEAEAIVIDVLQKMIDFLINRLPQDITPAEH